MVEGGMIERLAQDRIQKSLAGASYRTRKLDWRSLCCGLRTTPQAIPPFALRVCPLTHRLPSPLRKCTTSAISSGVPIRFTGLNPAIIFSICSFLPLKKRSVPVGPGATALTQMFWRIRSLDMTRTICSMAPLVVLYSR